MIYTATITPGEALPDGTLDPLYWASLDGDTYLPVSRPAQPGDEETIAQLFEGDGNFKPLVWGERGIHFAALQVKGDVEFSEVGDA